MTVFQLFNCAILMFGPHAVYYSAMLLSEYDTICTSVKVALVYLGTALVKLVCLATSLKVSDNESFDPYQMNSGEPQLHQTTTSSLELPLSLLCKHRAHQRPHFPAKHHHKTTTTQSVLLRTHREGLSLCSQF